MRRYILGYFAIQATLFVIKTIIIGSAPFSLTKRNLLMEIHSCHAGFAIALYHTQKLPAVSFIKAGMIRDQINRKNAFGFHILDNYIEQMTCYSFALERPIYNGTTLPQYSLIPHYLSMLYSQDFSSTILLTNIPAENQRLHHVRRTLRFSRRNACCIDFYISN